MKTRNMAINHWFRGGSKHRMFISIQRRCDVSEYTTNRAIFYNYSDAITYAWGEDVAIVDGWRHINYTFLRIRRDWERVNLAWDARRWHKSRLNVIWTWIPREDALRVAGG